MVRMPPFVSLSSDFRAQSRGVGAMEAAVRDICPQAVVIHLAHGIRAFDRRAAAWTLEAIPSLPVGCHVCVVDPGVGTARKGIAIETRRGDVLIGPDNGILLPAAHMLGGAVRAFELATPAHQRHPVSAVFHGRDVFAPAAAHLANGVPMSDLGPPIPVSELQPAPYPEARIENRVARAEALHVNAFGSVHLNIRQSAWPALAIAEGDRVEVRFPTVSVPAVAGRTFGDAPKGEAVIFPDDFGRIELALNQGNLAQAFGIAEADPCLVSRTRQANL